MPISDLTPPPPDPSSATAWQPDLDLVRRSLSARPSSAPGAIVLVISLALFVLASKSGGTGLRELGILVAVLFVHELGHLAAMRLMGYADLSLFFIPFFGAAAGGHKRGAPGWQQVIVSLAGPVPGIALGFVLAVAGLLQPSPFLHEAATWLLIVNGFNLLPVLPFDGGRVFEQVLFCRHRFLEISFRLLAVLVLGGMALGGGDWVLGLLAFMLLAGLPATQREIGVVQELRRLHPQVPAEPEKLSEAELAALLEGAQRLAPATSDGTNKPLEAALRNVYDRLLRRAPGALASVGLLAVWGGAFLAILASLMINSIGTAPTQAQAKIEEAAAYFERGDNAKAEEALGSCATFQTAVEAGSSARFRCASLLGRLRERQGRHAEAEAVLARALETRDGDEPDPEMVEAINALAAAKRALGKAEEAEKLRFEAARIVAEAIGE